MRHCTRVVLLSLFFLCSFFGYSQSKPNQLEAKNEFKIDVFDFVVLNAFEISYERLDKDKSFGFSVFVNSSEKNNFEEKFAITPFFRMYIFNKESFGAKGYFVEVFTKLVSGTSSEEYGTDFIDHNYFNMNLGFSLGKKWVHKNGLGLEYSLGIGRSLGAVKYAPDLTVRGGVSVGYRF